MATSLMDKNLAGQGLAPTKNVQWNLSPAVLVEQAVRRSEGMLTEDGAFVGITAPHTGRSPDDKFVAKDPEHEARVWWGKVNVALERAKFDRLHADVRAHLNDQD